MKRLAIVPLVLVACGACWIVLREEPSRAPSNRGGAVVTRSAAQPARVALAAPTGAVRAAETTAPASLAALPVTPEGRRPGEVSVAEGARHVAGYLAQADRPADVKALAAALAQDAEMLPLVTAEARRFASSSDAAVRARGVVILASTGALDADGWRRTLATESDASARAQIVATPPFGHGQDERVLDALVEVAQRDGSSEVRVAAVAALPAQLGAARLASLVRILQEDRSPEVRRTTATWFRGAELADATVVRGLWASATGSSEETSVRRASARALVRIEESRPGALAAAGATADQLEAVLAGTSQDRG